LERKRKEFAAKGIHVAALSYDSVELLKHYADRSDITYPLLSDPESKVIKAFGILNETIPASHQFFGVPVPGEYLIGPDGVVKAKYFEDFYRDRFTAGQILVRTLGSESGAARQVSETPHLQVTSWASDAAVRGGNRFSLVLDVDLGPKMHVYAPAVEGYIPIDWQVEEVTGLTRFDVEYPKSHDLHLPAIGETVPVYEGSFRLLTDVMVGQPKDIGHLLNEDGRLVVRGTLKYQACDDKVCYLPTSVPLEWTIDFEEHDRQRAPEAIRR
jgi:hypothetical protein